MLSHCGVLEAISHTDCALQGRYIIYALAWLELMKIFSCFEDSTCVLLCYVGHWISRSFC